MGIFGLGHRHISPETLAEYLDGRLRSQTRERLERVMAVCADCRLEMESLRDTVAMLRQLPVMAPRRSFIMSAPPQVATQTVRRAPPISPFRVPQWAYAGAASVAALALAVLVSVDASGLVAPDLPSAAILERSENAPAAAGSEISTIERMTERTMESAGAKEDLQSEMALQPSEASSIRVELKTIVETPAVAEMQAPAAAAEIQAETPAVAESRAQVPLVAEMQAEAPAVAESQAQDPAVAVMQAETATQKSLEPSAEQFQTAREPSDKSAQREQAAQPATAEAAAIQLEQASDVQLETAEVLPLPTVVSGEATSEPAQVPKQAQEPRVTPDEPAALTSQETPLIWRLFEGAAAVLFLVLAAVFFLTRRAARRF